MTRQNPVAIDAQRHSGNRLLLAWIRLLRPTHWVKNAFVLAPLLFSRSFHDGEDVLRATLAFVVFCLVASAVYIWNDCRDQDVDRLHHWKQDRPIASGIVSSRHALWVAAVLLATAGALLLLTPAISVHVALYLAINTGYSWGLKRIPWLDLFLLASGFVIRVYAGAAAISVDLSAWMLFATWTLAIYLASWKRYAELHNHGSAGRPVLEGYRLEHLRLVALLAGAASLICYGLFIAVVRHALWPTLVPVVAGVCRYAWLVLKRGHGDNPFTVIARDPLLAVTTLVWALSTLLLLW